MPGGPVGDQSVEFLQDGSRVEHVLFLCVGPGPRLRARLTHLAVCVRFDLVRRGLGHDGFAKPFPDPFTRGRKEVAPVIGFEVTKKPGGIISVVGHQGAGGQIPSQATVLREHCRGLPEQEQRIPLGMPL